MKLCFIIDSYGWAYYQTSMLLKKHMDHEITVITIPEVKEYDLSQFDHVHMLGFIPQFGNEKYAEMKHYSFCCNSDRSTAILLDKRLRDLVEKADGVISVNRKLHEFIKYFNKNATYINNGLDFDLFKPNRKKNKEFTVGFSGNVSNPQYDDLKGFSQFVKPACDKAGVKLDFLHYGVNQRPLEMMPDWYNRIDVLISASISEGDSQTINSAMACKTPIMATNVGALPEYGVAGQNFIEIWRDVQQITDCINWYKANPRELIPIAENGYKLVHDKHDPKKVAEQYNKFFHGIVYGKKQERK